MNGPGARSGGRRGDRRDKDQDSGFCFDLSCLPNRKEDIPPKNSNQLSPSSEPVEDIEKASVNAIFRMALAIQAEGKLDEACKLYEQIVVLDRDHLDSWYNLGHIREEQQNSKEAVRCLKEALRINPDDKESHLLMAYAMESLEDIQGAVTHYKEATRIDPTCTNAHYNLANAYHDMNMLDESASEYRKVLEIEPENVDCYFNLGVVLQDAGQLGEALASYEAASRLNPALEDATTAANGIKAFMAESASEPSVP